MKTLALLCLAMFSLIQAIPLQSHLSLDEEECISLTGVLREAVLQDKTENPPSLNPIKDPKFTEYLDCYADKLDRAGKLFYIKDVFVKIPGYRTKKFLPGVFCTEDELSGKVPVERQCALPPPVSKKSTV